MTSTRSSVSRRSSSRALELRLARVDRGLQPLAQRVERHARLAVANLAERELQLALAAEELDPHPLDLVDRRGRLEGCERVFLECLGVHGSAEVTNALASDSQPFAVSDAGARRAPMYTPTSTSSPPSTRLHPTGSSSSQAESATARRG